MKKYILTAVLALASTSAMADRIVTGKSNNEYETKQAACYSAKTNVSAQKNSDEEVESYSACDCDKKPSGNYVCYVDAKLDKKQ